MVHITALALFAPRPRLPKGDTPAMAWSPSHGIMMTRNKLSFKERRPKGPTPRRRRRRHRDAATSGPEHANT